MSLSASRQKLLDTISAANIKAYYGTGNFSTPCARIYPSQPWVGPTSLGGGARTQQWEVWAVAGRVDSGATYDDLESLVQAIASATEGMQGWSRIVWDRPTNVVMGGITYTACRGVTETREAV